MRINNNLMAMNTHRQLGLNASAGAKSIEKLSSGLRINRAGDDAAGLAISEKMRAQIRGLNMASKNSQDGISLIQTAEGALNETHDILQRMRELAVQAANDTNVNVDRSQIQKEINQLTTEVNRIGSTTEFNTMKLLNGDKMKSLKTTPGTGTSLITAGNVAVADPIAGYSVTGNSNLSAAIGTIATEAGNYADNASTAGATITVTKTSTGYTIKLNATQTAGQSFSASDTIVANTDGSFSYDNHGVSFSITKAQDANVTGGSTITIDDGADTAGISTSYSLESDWNFASTSSGTTISMTSGITFAQTADNAGARYIKIEGSETGVKVSLMDGSTATAAVTQFDTFTFTAATTLNYDLHGITFDLVVAGTATFTMSAVISLTAQLALTTTYAASDYNDNALKFQVGANESQLMALEIGDMRAVGLGITSASAATGFTAGAVVSDGTSTTNTEFALDVSTAANAGNAITKLNDAISTVSDERAKLGSVQNRLEHTIKNLDTSSENLQSAESRIRDVDMAKEMMTFTKNNILQQAAQAMLAQANQAPQGVLQLLR